MHRDPDEGLYLTVTAHVPGDVLTPITEPKARILVEDLLPLTSSGAQVASGTPRGSSRSLPQE